MGLHQRVQFTCSSAGATVYVCARPCVRAPRWVVGRCVPSPAAALEAAPAVVAVLFAAADCKQEARRDEEGERASVGRRERLERQRRRRKHSQGSCRCVLDTYDTTRCLGAHTSSEIASRWQRRLGNTGASTERENGKQGGADGRTLPTAAAAFTVPVAPDPPPVAAATAPPAGLAAPAAAAVPAAATEASARACWFGFPTGKERCHIN